MHAEVAARGLGYAWERDHCPAVNAGPDKEVGHSAPGDLRTSRGELLHVDFGVSRDDYCSDLQRVWYLLDEGETSPPEDVHARLGRRCGPRSTRGAGSRPGAIGLGGRRGGAREPRRRRLPGAEVRARSPARAHRARRRDAARAALGPVRDGSARPRRGGERLHRSSSGRPSRAAATSGSRKTSSSRPTASSGSARRSASSGSSPERNLQRRGALVRRVT